MMTSVPSETAPPEQDDNRSRQQAGRIQVRRPPLFEAGQLLTAEDLNELARYSRHHLALRASRRSRGVVAGLHVHSAVDRSCLVIGPGYAIADKGEELVLERPLTVPLRVLIGDAMPDVDGSHRAVEPDDLTRISGIDTILRDELNALGFDRFEHIAMFTEEDKRRVDEVLDFKGRFERERWVEQAKMLLAERPRSKGAAYDLYARPATDAQDLAASKSAGATVDHCYDLVLLPATGDGPEVPWLSTFAEMLGPIKALVRQHLAEPAVGFVEAFKASIKTCPPRFFPMLIDEAAGLQAYPPPTPHERCRLAWLLAFDRIREHLAIDRASSDPNGLRLAKVWVDLVGDDRLEVAMVDETARQNASALYRHLPAPPAMLNVAPLLGEDCLKARAHLEQAGVNVRRLNAIALDDDACLDALTRLVTAPPFAEIGAFYDIDYINLDGLGARAIGFHPVASLHEDGLITELACRPERAIPGDQVTFVLTLENVGKEIIDIEASSSSIAVDIAHEQLLPRARLVVNAPMTVPHRLGEQLPDHWTDLGDGFFRFDATVDIRSTGGRADRRVEAKLVVNDRSAIKPLLLSVEQEVLPPLLFSDRRLSLEFVLTNHSDVALDVDLKDADDLRLEPTPIHLQPGQSKTWRPTSPSSFRAAKAFFLKATGRAEDGRLVVTTAKVRALQDPFSRHLARWGWIYLLCLLALAVLLFMNAEYGQTS